MKEGLEEVSLRGISGREILESLPGDSRDLLKVQVGRCLWLSHLQLPFGSCTAGSSLKWPQKTLDQLKRKHRIHHTFGFAATQTKHIWVD